MDEIVLQQTMPLPPNNHQTEVGTAGNRIDDGDQVISLPRSSVDIFLHLRARCDYLCGLLPSRPSKVKLSFARQTA